MRVIENPITREMARLYIEEEWTMPQIAERFGVIKQAVHARLAKVGISRRPRKHTQIDKSALETLYAQNISIERIAEHFATHSFLIYDALKFHKIPKRKPIAFGGKYSSVLRDLAVGATTEIVIQTKSPQAQLHRAAEAVEIKISVRSIGDGKFNVTRID